MKNVVEGKYVKSMEGYPKASNQKYKLPVVEVFDVENGKIASLSTHYNDKEWARIVGAKK